MRIRGFDNQDVPKPWLCLVVAQDIGNQAPWMRIPHEHLVMLSNRMAEARTIVPDFGSRKYRAHWSRQSVSLNGLPQAGSPYGYQDEAPKDTHPNLDVM